MSEVTSTRAELPPFHTFSARESVRRAPRSIGVAWIIVASIVVVALNGFAPGVGRAFEVRDDALAAHQYWRLLTYVFPHHGGWVHVILNMALLGLYGWQLERIVGTVRFLFVYFAGGAVAMVALSTFRQINDGTGLTSGASLAIFAVVSALVVIYAMAGRRLDAVRAVATVLVLLVLAGVTSMLRRRVGGAVSTVPTGFAGIVFGIVNHAVGVAVGLVLGLLVHRRSYLGRTVVG